MQLQDSPVLREKQPLPSAGKVQKKETVEALRYLVQAVPLRVELMNLLVESLAFEPPVQEALGSITLVFVCQYAMEQPVHLLMGICSDMGLGLGLILGIRLNLELGLWPEPSPDPVPCMTISTPLHLSMESFEVAMA